MSPTSLIGRKGTNAKGKAFYFTAYNLWQYHKELFRLQQLTFDEYITSPSSDFSIESLKSKKTGLAATLWAWQAIQIISKRFFSNTVAPHAMAEYLRHVLLPPFV